MSTTQALKVFEDKRIRTFWDDQDEKWLFCINDIIEALTESSDPADYFKTRRKRDKDLDDFVRGSNCPTHSFVSTDGKPHAVKCMDLKGIFRIIQSIPSKKAEPFKRWLASSLYRTTSGWDTLITGSTNVSRVSRFAKT